MTREQMKTLFTVHTNGQDEWIRVDKRTYDKAIDKFCDEYEAQLQAKDQEIERLKADKSCVGCFYYSKKYDNFCEKHNVNMPYQPKGRKFCCNHYAPKTIEGQDMYVKMLQKAYAKD